MLAVECVDVSDGTEKANEEIAPAAFTQQVLGAELERNIQAISGHRAHHRLRPSVVVDSQYCRSYLNVSTTVNETAQDMRSVAYVMLEMLTGLRVRGYLMEKCNLLAKVAADSHEHQVLRSLLELESLEAILEHPYFSSATEVGGTSIQNPAMLTHEQQHIIGNLTKQELTKCHTMKRQHLQQIRTWQTQFEKKYRRKPRPADLPSGIIRLHGRCRALNERMKNLNDRLAAGHGSIYRLICSKDPLVLDATIQSKPAEQESSIDPHVELPNTTSAEAGASRTDSSGREGGKRSPAQKAFLNRFAPVRENTNVKVKIKNVSRLSSARQFSSRMYSAILDREGLLGVNGKKFHIILVTLLSYISDYDSKIEGFDALKWYNDEWVAMFLNEVQMVVVVSWADLLSRCIFSLGVALVTANMKDLIRRAPDTKQQPIANKIAVRTNKTGNHNRRTTPSSPKLTTVVPASLLAIFNYRCDTGLPTRVGHRTLQAAHLLFGIWGIVVLALHVQAAAIPSLPQCSLQVHTWGVSKPACYLAVLDCHKLEISGRLVEVETKWKEFDRSTVVSLLFRHYCPALEVPDLFNDFHRVTNIKLYNSTIQQWSASAAISNTNHPNVVWLYVIRVNMTDGVLPAGLQSIDFPLKLQDIEFCYTNLRELPEDLDFKWLQGSIIFIEHSQLTCVPPVLTRLAPYYVSLTGNPITELHPDIFELPNIQYLILGDIDIVELPRDVTKLSPMLFSIYLSGTNVSFFWSWIDALVSRNSELGEPTLFMGGSTYCTELESLVNGVSSSLTVFRIMSCAASEGFISKSE
ncbi:unnamed protein product [Phytophthora fragariaefolia]|uniref:Unnamed protein product n=1 Tax=Phytophthora fragariaefolia TaxID=1490495 RepID=A0A9W6Y5P9_9STRA|nr:unnamed protein product [Phytophthora fragariaefolia]